MVNVVLKAANAVRWHKAITNFERDNLDQSLRGAHKILRGEPDSPLAKLLLAMIHLKKGEFEESFNLFNEVKEGSNKRGSDNARYTAIFAEVFIVKMSEEDPDISKLYEESRKLSCSPALRRWFPLYLPERD